MRKIKVAIAGNPNSGKSTIFNNLTGGKAKLGNYPGVTVEKMEGIKSCGDFEFHFIDLPGIYSLTTRSKEELIARTFLTEEKPDIVINVVDASHIERNLYLTVQLKELGAPVIIALNMSDIAEAKGHLIDLEMLSKLLGVPIVKTVGNKNSGMNDLVKSCCNYIVGSEKIENRTVKYGPEIEKQLDLIEAELDKNQINVKYPKRWIAIKLLEDDSEICAYVQKFKNSNEIFDRIAEATKYFKDIYNEDPEILLVDKRYGFISGAHSEVAKYTKEIKHDFSDQLDVVLTHKFFGLPIFFFIMWVIFTATFKLGDPFVGFIEHIFILLQTQSNNLLPHGFISSLISDGIIAGVGGVISFLPNIIMLYIFISILEDSGYMARAAFLMDGLMHKIGLHGKSFIPMIIGFGCSVPAIMATRILESKKDRYTTMLIIPFMSCGAKLTVYTLLIGAFFSKDNAGNILFSIYFIGILMAIFVSLILTKFVFKEPTSHFVMELPPYLRPTGKGVFLHMWRRSWLYLKKAGTVILGLSIILWFLSNFPSNSPDPKERLEKSFVGYAGKLITPVLEPIGLGDWKISVAAATGFAAKEVVISTLATLHSLEGGNENSQNLRQALRKNPAFNPLVAYVLMLFILISCPCFATFAIIKQETKSLRWPVFMAAYTTVIAWIVCFIFYHGGKLLGL